jgi:hypothetical protein
MSTVEINEALINKLNECATECNRCFASCLEEEDVSMMARCIELDIDCSEICNLTSSFLSRDSESSSTLLALCGEICRACADECAKHEVDHCQRCAKVCNECAKMCEEN